MIIRLNELKAWMIIHLGKNPRNGGTPPRERMPTINEATIIGVRSRAGVEDRIDEIEA